MSQAGTLGRLRWRSARSVAAADLLRRRPEWLVLVLAGIGWLLMVPLLWSHPETSMPGMAAPMAGHDHAAHQHGITTSPAEAATSPLIMVQLGQLAAALLGWLVMAGAMMLPTAVPAIRYVAFSSRRDRRQYPVLAFVVGFLLAWTPLGLVASLGHLLAQPGSTALTAAAVAVAAGWELTRMKHRGLLRCHRTEPIRFSGWAALRSSAAFGWRNGCSCVLACGPAMLALMLAGHPVVLTLVVAVIMFAEKMLRRGWRLTAAVAAAGWGFAALVLGFQLSP
ncbi:DUF2182 domain-containing protein [Microlunatus panaciterrae]|uniref:Metal-binding membrane protein n=1 Tax=Microlunatus panaciterrae TaxID=400768 RepID=A0ABS2REX5_9ACTN|nr:DUF2182 domain-containing protein [Microlunatus panaciterrae]MBM7797564.1 putative metal-binding membrane protein [Microlunatus panaciterrae]